MNLLEQLKQYSDVVADTGDLEAIRRFSPLDATTNPSIILKAINTGEYDALVTEAITWAQSQNTPASEMAAKVADRLVVLMGCEILKSIPGRVSTEVPAALSFDTQATVEKARALVAYYEELGVSRAKVLIKIAATWEGIKAAEVLEKEGIETNLTLIFNFAQARACAEAGVFLISPFVGRILDWYRKANPAKDYAPAEEPGVESVSSIYQYFREHGYATVVMGASFRNIGEILALAGCDRLTISPALLDELASTEGELSPSLIFKGEPKAAPEALSEAAFRWMMNEDPMATEKLAEGIRVFAQDQQVLEALLAERIAEVAHA